MERSRQFQRLQWLSIGMLAAFLAVAAMLSYWAIVRGAALEQRPDNPRRVEAELRIRRGRILDAEDTVLAETVGPPEAPRRIYALDQGGPAIGYYSFRYGTAGVEAGYDGVLRGDSESVWETFWRHNLHEAQQGRDIRLTLNGSRQRVAEALLGERSGAIVLLTLPEAAISAMVSHPGYNPNNLDASFEELVGDPRSPLLNRATQGQYQPGLALQPFLLAGVLDAGVINLGDQVVDAGRPVAINSQTATCVSPPPETATWQDVLQHACPYPMHNLAGELEATDVAAILEAFGFTDTPNVPLAVADPPELALTGLPGDMLGQGALTLTPLQLALSLAALANEGTVPSPVLVSAVETESGVWQSLPATETGQQAVSAATAAQILGALPQHAGTIAEFAARALAGPEGTSNGWYLGLAPAQEPRYAVVVVVEEAAGTGRAAAVGRALLNHVLAEGN